MKISVILSNVGSCSDRYMAGGYRNGFSVEQLLQRIGTLEEIQGVELIGGWNVTADNAVMISDALRSKGLEAVAIIPDHFGRPLWGKGAFTHPDPEIRAAAVQETMDMVAAARIIGCKTISIWNGQDGFDYPFQADYSKAYGWLAEGIRTCADMAPDIRFCIEYKPKEPRNHSFVSNVHSTLLLIQDIHRSNVGVTIDTGHAALAYENIALAAVAAASRGKLFHMHINDNYGFWDDDMMTGSVHTIEYLELFWWLKKIGYSGWLSIDQYPYREESLEAAQESIRWIHALDAAAARIDSNTMQEILDRNDAVAATRLIRELLFG